MSETAYKYALSHRFVVEIEEIKISFTKVSGLDVEIEFETYNEGGVNDGPLEFIMSRRNGNLVLERGVGNKMGLIKWFEDIQVGKITKKSGTIDLKDSNGKTLRSWTFEGAYPIKWSGPSMDASGQDVALEVLELSYGGLKSVVKP